MAHPRTGDAGTLAATRSQSLLPTSKHHDLIYDVGMHRGEDTEFYLREGFRVIAFEADPDGVQACTERFQDFIDQGRLKIVEGAIVDPYSVSPGQKTVTFYKNNTDSVFGTVDQAWNERNKKLGTSMSAITVDIVDFETTMQTHGIPHYMKVDIEGSDMVCVRALRRFQERPDYVSFESDKTSFARIRSEIDLLLSLGYDSFQAVEQSGIPTSQRPPRESREGASVAHTFPAGSSGLFGADLGGTWRSRKDILRHYRMVRAGYFFFGEDGIMNPWTFRGSWRLRHFTRRVIQRSTRATVPGWYDTHARLARETSR